ncbi:MAG: ABC transporter permease [Candidatus Delongbacteria bacterium]|nr:ABC transporter permease [Candidatus Delongbacteria bacterium]
MSPSNLEKKHQAKSNLSSWILTLPGLIWLLVFFFVPYSVILLYSFMTPNVYDINYVFSFDAYQNIFHTNYIGSFLISLRLALVTTLISLLMGYPVAYYIARSSVRIKNFLLILIIVPFWTNFIIRIFSWRIFLAPDGVLNSVLLNLHLVDGPLRILRTDFAVILVMVYVYLPYMILPLYSVLEKIDFTLLDAAKDLGADSWKAFYKITLPLSKQGIIAGAILVFIPSLGAYIIPQIVGNQNSLYIGQIITYKIKNIPRNWPLASGLSLILLAIIVVLLIGFYQTYRRLKRKENGIYDFK